MYLLATAMWRYKEVLVLQVRGVICPQLSLFYTDHQIEAQTYAGVGSINCCFAVDLFNMLVPYLALFLARLIWTAGE